jgi:hypothetical protein
MSWEDTFTSWAQGPGTTEQERCEPTERMIHDALKSDSELAKMDIQVFTQGSFKAKTNVRQDSDIDVCILNREQILYEAPAGATNQDLGLGDTGLNFFTFKDMVENALVKKFGRPGVTRGKKAFDVHANSYRVDADVLPAFRYRWYTRDAAGRMSYVSGISFLTDDSSTRIINWPDQTYTNGVRKNDATLRRYKRVIRILKRLRNKMQDDKITAAQNVHSFLIESLVWNAPNSSFGHSGYYSDVREVLAHTFNHTIKDEDCQEWGEVNELKYLFRPSQRWTREQAHAFLSAAWDYVGFK